MSEWPYVGGEMADLVRALDWSSTPLGPIESWPPELLATAMLVLGNPFPAALIWGRELITIYNDGFRPILGGKAEALGRSFADIWSEAWNDIGPIAERAMAGEATFIKDYPLVVERNGEPELAFFTFSYSPVRGADGSVLGMMDTVVETTEAVRAREALAASEERYRTMFETMDEGYLLADVIFDATGKAVDIEYVTSNPAAIRMVGIDLTGRRLRDVADYEEYWYEIWGRVAVTGKPERLERYAAPEGIWYEFYVFKTEPDDSESRRVGVLFNDGTRRKIAEDALRRSEERKTFLLDLGDALRSEPDPQAVGELAVKMLGERLAADRCYFCEISVAQDRATVLADFHGDGLRSIAGDYRLCDFPQPMPRTGGALAFSDCRNDAQLSERDRAAFARLGMGSFLTRTIRKGEHGLHWSLTVTTREPRQWSEEDREILGDAAEKVWLAIERARAETTLRETQERQEFLLQLSDALRPLSDPNEIKLTAVRVLGRHLGACRVAYAENDEEHGSFIVSPNYVDGVREVVGSYRYGVYGPGTLIELSTGKTRIQPDIANDPFLGEEERKALAASGVGASIDVPLVKDGRLIAFLGVNYPTAHDFQPREVQLVLEVAERTWAAVERARVEAALHESERRFQQFANSSSDVLWIRDAETMKLEYLSSAFEAVFGIPGTAVMGKVEHSTRLVVPDDRDMVLQRLEAARRGEAQVYEFRILREADGAFRWIRSHCFPLLDERGRVQRIGGIAQDVTEFKLATEHQEILLAELQHRVRNIMAMIRAVNARTADSAEAVDDYRDLMAGRLLALSRVQALLTRSANQNISIGSIVRNEISAQAGHDGQFTLEGPDVVLSPKAAEILTLALHELSTNALKYGALSVEHGRIEVRWKVAERRQKPWLEFEWVERGGPKPAEAAPGLPRRRGFGSELIEGKIPYELRGKGVRILEPEGLRCHIEFPLKDGDSILETDAPMRATVFGGTLDMSGAADLSGHVILVVEDDFYLASDAARALRGAGAKVLGPCPDEESALEELSKGKATAVLLDINLGHGANFTIAAAVQQAGIPFVFITGYDEYVFPAQFAGVPRLQKPVQLWQIVDAFGNLPPPPP